MSAKRKPPSPHPATDTTGATADALVIDGATPLPASLQASFDAASRFLDGALSAATRRAYAGDWDAFGDWCRRHGFAPLPATAATVALYLAERALSGARPASLNRYRAAIRYYHVRHQQPSPTDDPGIKQLLAGVRREKGVAQDAKKAAAVELVERMVALCRHDAAGLRDRALLLIGFAGAFRRSELVALTVADLSRVAQGLEITVRRSKTDQTGFGQTVAIPNGRRLQPVAALDAWLEHAAIDSGPLFRRVRKNGLIGTAALSDQSVAHIVKRYAARLGLEPARFAGHSLRSGFVTSAAHADASLLKTAAQTRHRSLAMVKRYFDDAERFDRHAGEDFL